MGEAKCAVHRVAEAVDVWVCGMAWLGERGTDDPLRVTCRSCREHRYRDGTPAVNVRMAA